MLEFPIDEIYRRVAKFDALREDKDIVIGSGSGFFLLLYDRQYLLQRYFGSNHLFL